MGGEDTHNPVLGHRADDAADGGIPPIGFVKTHKTGSSTVASIILRVGLEHNRSVMLPETDDTHLGWPASFPGSEVDRASGGPRHQYDVIVHHAVFNNAAYRSYLRPKPFFITVLREPTSQAISAYHYYTRVKDSLGDTTWAEHLDLIENGSHPIVFNALFRNSQAYDLGWYETQLGRTFGFINDSWISEAYKSDHDEVSVQAWIDTLDFDFRRSGIVLILEYIDEGLVLLRQRVGCRVSDMAYTIVNPRKDRPVLPSSEELLRLRAINSVDCKLYQHFNKTFWLKWNGGNQTVLNMELSELRHLNTELSRACSGNSSRPARCKANDLSLTRKLKVSRG